MYCVRSWRAICFLLYDVEIITTLKSRLGPLTLRIYARLYTAGRRWNLQTGGGYLLAADSNYQCNIVTEIFIQFYTAISREKP